jgi:hypothetical protein
MPDLDYLLREVGDDHLFLVVADRVISAIEQPYGTLVVVRVRNWFDHKWLRFSGNGRVPFEAHRLAHPGVALDSFWQDKLTFPPFSPRRIVREEHFPRANAGEVKAIHRRRRRQSAKNLHRRVEHHASSLLVAWVSTGSEATGRASLMIYAHDEGDLLAWYASFHRLGERWEIHRVKGVAKDEVALWIGEAPAPASGVLSRQA